MIVRSWNPFAAGPAAIWLSSPLANGPRQAAMLRRQLREYDDEGPIDIIIDGDGGNVATAEEIALAVRQDPRPKRVTILRAMSAHGVLAMVGDTIRIVEGGALGLHSSRLSRDAVLSFTATEALPAVALRALAAMCEEVDAAHVAIFARRTGLPEDLIRDLRAAETTLGAAEAVRLGFADEVVPWPAR